MSIFFYSCRFLNCSSNYDNFKDSRLSDFSQNNNFKDSRFSDFSQNNKLYGSIISIFDFDENYLQKSKLLTLQNVKDFLLSSLPSFSLSIAFALILLLIKQTKHPKMKLWILIVIPIFIYFLFGKFVSLPIYRHIEKLSQLKLVNKFNIKIFSIILIIILFGPLVSLLVLPFQKDKRKTTKICLIFTFVIFGLLILFYNILFLLKKDLKFYKD